MKVLIDNIILAPISILVPALLAFYVSETFYPRKENFIFFYIPFQLIIYFFAYKPLRKILYYLFRGDCSEWIDDCKKYNSNIIYTFDGFGVAVDFDNKKLYLKSDITNYEYVFSKIISIGYIIPGYSQSYTYCSGGKNSLSQQFACNAGDTLFNQMSKHKAREKSGLVITVNDDEDGPREWFVKLDCYNKKFVQIEEELIQLASKLKNCITSKEILVVQPAN